MKSRINSIKQAISKKNLDALIITNPANVSYATAFTGDDSWALITARAIYLITDSRYTEQAAGECPLCRIIERKEPITKSTAALLNKLKSAKTICIEKSTSLTTYSALKKLLDKKLKTVTNTIEPLRVIKDATEIAAIKQAARIAAMALDNTLKYIKPGTTENQLAGALDFEIRKLGARNSFETCVAFGPNASRPHHQPGPRKLKNNDTILIDFGVRYKNYCSDITRCFTIGKQNRLYKKVYETVRQAHDAAIEQIKDGVEIKHVDAAARNVIEKSDFPPYGHGTGHGLGIEVHEQPIIAAKSKGKLKAGMVITIEPGIYIPGKLGVRLEDDILVTKTGHKILSPKTKEIQL